MQQLLWILVLSGCDSRYQETAPSSKHSLPKPHIEPTPIALFTDLELTEAGKHVGELRMMLNTLMNGVVYKGEYDAVDIANKDELFRFLDSHRKKIYRGVRWDLTIAGMGVQIDTVEEADGRLSKYILFTSASETSVPELQRLTREKGKMILFTIFKLPDLMEWKEMYTSVFGKPGPASIEGVYGKALVAGRRIEASVKQDGRIEVSVIEPFHTPFGKR